MFSYNVALNGIVTFLPLNFTPSFDIRRGVARIFQRGGGHTVSK